MKIPRFGNQVRKGWPRVIWRSGPRWKDVRFFDFQSNGAFKLQKGGTFGSACQNLSPMLSSMSGAIRAKPERIRTSNISMFFLQTVFPDAERIFFVKDSITIALSCFWIHLPLASSILPALRCRTYRCKAQAFSGRKFWRILMSEDFAMQKQMCFVCFTVFFFCEFHSHKNIQKLGLFQTKNHIAHKFRQYSCWI